MQKRIFITVAGAFLGLAVTAWPRRAGRLDVRGKTVLITGGSRGLGLLLAKEFAARGARIAISARLKDELDRAKDQLLRITKQVLTLEADITMREEAENAIRTVEQKFGRLDILVNNAGTITVGPVESMTIDDFRDSLDTHFWAPYFTTMAALPSMRRRKSGSIVNISSVGGKLSVPHLLPYSVGKFALTGFSEGLRSELLKDNVYVTTVCPGLMRTGSPRNALFKAQNEAEYAWFSISDALPIVSMSATRAAKQIVESCVQRQSELVLSFPAKLGVLLHGIAPGATVDLLGVINKLLPAPGGIGPSAKTGKQSSSKVSPSWLTTLNEEAAAQNNQMA
jgi:NAD(P)-dependent dehydrogenase (short-subunit alcohol dehydrogenase family)